MLSIIIAAFFGGIILNLMPCTLPVLSIKILSILQSESRKLSALSYLAGTQSSFLALSAILILAKQSGEVIGWGYQMQSPIFITILISIMYVIGLNLSGLFEVPSINITNQKKGVIGEFLAGFLVVLISTPCSAPIVVTAISFALSQANIDTIIIFQIIGLGLAFPYIAVAFSPVLQKCIPKPGKWMITLRKVLALPIYGSAIWLSWVLYTQIGEKAIYSSIVNLSSIASGIYILSRYCQNSKLSKIVIFSLFIVAVPAQFTYKLVYESQIIKLGNKMESFSRTKLKHYINNGRIVLVEATASWCAICQYEKLTVRSEKFLKTLEQHNVVHMRADWSSRDDRITEYMASVGRHSVPTYALYLRNDTPLVVKKDEILPKILSFAQ